VLANEIDDKAVQQEPVIYNGVDPEVSAGIDIVCRDIKNNRDEIVDDDKDYPEYDDETENVAVRDRKTEVQVLCKE
jgi:hypothetical protein